MDRGEYVESWCGIDDYDDAVTSTEDEEVCMTPSMTSGGK